MISIQTIFDYSADKVIIRFCKSTYGKIKHVIGLIPNKLKKSIKWWFIFTLPIILFGCLINSIFALGITSFGTCMFGFVVGFIGQIIVEVRFNKI